MALGIRVAPAPTPLTLPRRRPLGRARSTRRLGAEVFAVLAIAAAFLVGLVYLAHVLQVAGSRYDIDRLVSERGRLERELRSLQGEIARWRAEPTVVEAAQQAGLDPLGESVRVPAR